MPTEKKPRRTKDEYKSAPPPTAEEKMSGIAEMAASEALAKSGPPAGTYAAPLTPDMPVTLTHTVGGLSVEVPPIVREESAEKWGYKDEPQSVSEKPVGGVYPAVPLPPAYVGSTGIRLDGVCGNCDGDGVLATTDRAATHPEKYPDEIVKCGSCGGLGGRTAEDGARGRAASEAYKRALFGDEATEGFSLAGVPDGSVTPTEVVIAPSAKPVSCEEYATRILAEDPRTALALYRRVSRGYGLAEWRPLGAGAQLVDLGTGDMLALVAPEGRRFVASYVESGTNLAGPTADTLDACKDAVGNRMRARGVGVL